MSQANSSFRTVKSKKGDHEATSHVIHKGESRLLSKFQSLGNLLRWVDEMAKDGSDDGRSITALLSFDAEVAALGFDPYDPVHILTAPSWKIRMYAAWCVLGGAERAIAAQLNYTEVHNYWPNADFCDPAWDEEVRQWAATVTSYDEPSEFDIASVAGYPSRPKLEFKD
ncbi:hypothetical protein [Pseudomonas coronafaciens]|uniref:hypothetical protein n=1 Tax=Pseudomonas coronafaciens TaxID=53409 RepID=UPI0006B58590|nr:hypothetical protein [Pseudomonas coronafaciens]RMS98110.1 hypothetical protein ALP55_01057 [Pseudomonas coronafaciens pv. oryzae]